MTSPPRTARAITRAENTRAILDSATMQLGQVGPAALSLRAVARDVSMASSAVYRYFPSRDALLTALIVEAYDDLGAAMEAADTSVAADDHAERWRAICLALRDWAVAHPHRYALTYGSPVPGYAAPQDTVGPAARVAVVLLGLIADAQVARRTPTPAAAPTPDEVAALGPILALTDPPLRPEYAARGLTAWATLFGHLSLELFGHMHRGVLDYDAHFAHVVELLSLDLGLTS